VVVAPEYLSVGRIQGKHIVARTGQVHHAIYDERLSLKFFLGTRKKCLAHSKTIEVVAVDLVQAAKAPTAVISVVEHPIEPANVRIQHRAHLALLTCC
jgi:hypothetical protein